MSRPEQIEHEMDYLVATDFGQKPWGKVKRSHKDKKKRMHRQERRKYKEDFEYTPEYRKYYGYEW
jgi:hypothetical protein